MKMPTSIGHCTALMEFTDIIQVPHALLSIKTRAAYKMTTSRPLRCLSWTKEGRLHLIKSFSLDVIKDQREKLFLFSYKLQPLEN